MIRLGGRFDRPGDKDRYRAIPHSTYSVSKTLKIISDLDDTNVSHWRRKSIEIREFMREWWLVILYGMRIKRVSRWEVARK